MPTKFDYPRWEEDLKDLLSWFQKAVVEEVREGHAGGLDYWENKDRGSGVNNARIAIINHCRYLDKQRTMRNGIL